MIMELPEFANNSPAVKGWIFTEELKLPCYVPVV